MVAQLLTSPPGTKSDANVLTPGIVYLTMGAIINIKKNYLPANFVLKHIMPKKISKGILI